MRIYLDPYGRTITELRSPSPNYRLLMRPDGSLYAYPRALERAHSKIPTYPYQYRQLYPWRSEPPGLVLPRRY